ncbi:virulence factor TspB C-terminal domain-related protein [Acinetobacter baylyi]|uniref:virulence factor TspB C-terminal domain-related protein n=1 Tax=Acinetobacter baylyi TaxID=202950 RepID=UPI000EA0649E|nr:virulence factor TspB C-terminal domain-related protein [Acinetobacter baylyi]
MAINDDLHRYKDVLKKQISHAFRIYLSIAIILSPLYLMNNANAASLGGWTLGGSVVNGASVILNGSKELILNGASKIANGTAKITPNAAQVSKALAGGAAAVALDLAIKELLGAVDYVLDPANNSITYTKKVTTDPAPTDQYRWYFAGGSAFGGDHYYSYSLSPSSVCNAMLQSMTGLSPWYYNKISVSSSSVTSITCYVSSTSTSFNGNSGAQREANPLYDPSATDDNQPKSLPLSTVANQVISMAEGGNATAQQAIKAAADTIVAEAETDSTKARPIVSQFEQTSTIETSETATSTSETTSTANPEETATTQTETSFPVFCNWAPTLCQAANVVIQKPAEWAENIKAAYDDAVDYFKEEPSDSDPEELEIEQPEFEAEQVNLQGSTDCPQDSVSFSLMGKSYTLEMPYQPVCNALDFFRPAVLAVGAITSAYIIAGIRTKEDES